jgi:hypothetical protein
VLEESGDSENTPWVTLQLGIYDRGLGIWEEDSIDCRYSFEGCSYCRVALLDDPFFRLRMLGGKRIEGWVRLLREHAQFLRLESGPRCIYLMRLCPVEDLGRRLQGARAG